jgi:hypothetical protein
MQPYFFTKILFLSILLKWQKRKSIEMAKEKKWISRHRLPNSQQNRTINYN